MIPPSPAMFFSLGTSASLFAFVPEVDLCKHRETLYWTYWNGNNRETNSMHPYVAGVCRCVVGHFVNDALCAEEEIMIPWITAKTSIWCRLMWKKIIKNSLTFNFYWINYTAFGRTSDSHLHTHTNTRTHIHASEKWILNTWKLEGTKALLCSLIWRTVTMFLSHRPPGGLDSWSVRVSPCCMFSGFTLLCWCKMIQIA